MALTYEPIASTTTAALTTTISFSGISQAYTDLKMVVNAQLNSGGSDWGVKVNGNSANNYSAVSVWGNNSSQYSSGYYASYVPWYITYWNGTGNMRDTVRNVNVFDFHNYSNPNMGKSVILYNHQVQNSALSGVIARQILYFNQTPGITSIEVYTISSVNFQIGTNITLYGIKAAI